MGDAAVMVAKSCQYIGAGTVEFLMDDQLNFYFLEMNTRLQVEHPVSEYITGLDLVEQQIRVARGESLSFTQEDLKIHGHAIELRVCAEDPLNNFLPSVGKLIRYHEPSGDNIRVDAGYVEGMDIPINYDPMIAKLVVHANNRTEAIQLMKTAIAGYHIEGVATTLSFGTFVMNHEAFISGHFDTNFVKQYYSADKLKDAQREKARIAALVALKYWLESRKEIKMAEPIASNWKSRLA
jgi:propionyl-CoA carboxylase alpha chain